MKARQAFRSWISAGFGCAVADEAGDFRCEGAGADCVESCAMRLTAKRTPTMAMRAALRDFMTYLPP